MICISPVRNTIPFERQVKAIYILGDDTKTSEGRKCYNEVFGSKNSGGYPSGQVLRFIPEISDPQYPVSPAMRAKVIKMMSKENSFLNSVVTIPTTTITGLHVYNDDIGHSLCQILMGLQIGADKDAPLFLSVEERLWGAAGY